MSGWTRSSLEREEVVEIGIGAYAEVSCHAMQREIESYILACCVQAYRAFA